MKNLTRFKNNYSAGILIALLLSLSSCGLIKPVMVTGVSDFTTVNPLSNPELRFNVGVRNPNWYSVRIEKMEIGISIGEPILAKATIMEGIRVTRKESIYIPIALAPGVNEISELFKSGVESFLTGKKDQQLKVRGEIIIRKFIFRKRYMINESIKI